MPGIEWGEPELREGRWRWVLLALFSTTFVIGAAELGVVGMLTEISDDLGTSVDATGALVTAYALGLSVGGPVLAGLTVRLPRRTLLVTALAVYLVVTVGASMSEGLGWLVVARAVAGSVHGLFVGVALTVAVAVSPPARAGNAISAVIAGFAASVAFGVPLGTLVGQMIGWRGSFLAMVAVGVLCFIGLLVAVPRLSIAPAEGMGAQIRYAFAPRVLAVLGLAVLVFAGQYATFTYIAPFLGEVTGVSAGSMSILLLVYGSATALGVLGGGWFADRAAGRTVVVAVAVVVLALGGLTTMGGSVAAVTALLVVWGVFGFGLVPSLQARIVSLAGPGRDLAATLPASAINAGIAIGSVAGGAAIATAGTSAVAPVGMVGCGAALVVAVLTLGLRPPAEPRTAPGEASGHILDARPEYGTTA